MTVSRQIDSNRLAVRMFSLVAGLILIPVFLTGVLAYRTLEQQVTSIKLDQMRADAKGWMLEAVQRVRMLDDIMQSNVQMVIDGTIYVHGQEIRPDDFNRIGFKRVEYMSPSDVEFAGLDFPQHIDATDWINSDADRLPVVTTRPALDSKSEVVLIYSIPGSEKLLAGVVDGEYLWGKQEYFSYQTWYCIVADGQFTLFCPTDNGAAFASSLASASAARRSDSVSVEYADEKFVGSYWSIGTLENILLPTLTVGVFQPESLVNEVIIGYRYRMFPVIGIAVLLAAWASLMLIRRQLRPIKQLTGAATKIADGNFMGTLRIDTKDEFGELGEAFDKMRQNLGRQFDHQTALARFDQLILESSEIAPIIAASITGLQTLLSGWRCWLSLVDGSTPDGGRCYFLASDGSVSSEPHAIAPDLIARLKNHSVGLKVDLSNSDCFMPYDALDAAVLLPIVSERETIGFIGLGSTTGQKFGPAELATVSDFNSRLGLAISSFHRDEQLFIQGHYDALTGLPNRALFKERLQASIDRHLKDGEWGALLYLDIDGFKVVNDTEGHSAGDEVLVQAAKRIADCVGEGGLVSRLGGDEFTVIYDHDQDKASLTRASAAILSSLQKPFTVDGRSFFVDGSIGIALIPEDGDSVDLLLRKADSAMYAAKEDGGGRAAFYESVMGETIKRRTEADRDLRQAFTSGDFDMHYQPQFDSRSGELVGAEALMRWTKPSRHSLSTQDFIELAERSGLIVELGYWALEKVCEDYIWLQDRGVALDSLAVNVSGRQLKEPDFVDRACEILSKYPIPAGAVQLEVTETVLVDERKCAGEVFIALQKHGFRIGIDDFGTGYSSLSYLRQFTFDTLKIDRAFVKDLPLDREACAIAEAIIAMARGLNKKVVAEGVENRQQLDYLSANECYVIQGYLYSPALEKHLFLQMADRFAGFDTTNHLKKLDEAAAVPA